MATTGPSSNTDDCVLKLFNCAILFYEKEECVEMTELLESISDRISLQKGKGVAKARAKDNDFVEPLDNLQSGYHPVGAAILTILALYDQIFWQIFRVLQLERSQLDYFSSWKSIDRAINNAAAENIGFLHGMDTAKCIHHTNVVKSQLKKTFGVDVADDGKNRMQQWKILLRDLRNRFLHRSVYLLKSDFKSLEAILDSNIDISEDISLLYEIFRHKENRRSSQICFGSSAKCVYTKELSYECKFQLYRMLLIEKSRQLFNVLIDFCESYSPRINPVVTNCAFKNESMFDQLMAVYASEDDAVDDDSILAYIEYQMDLEENIARAFLYAYTEDTIPETPTATTLTGSDDGPFPAYSITYKGYRFIEMTVLTIASSFDQIMWCLIQIIDKKMSTSISFFGSMHDDTINKLRVHLKLERNEVLRILGYDTNGIVMHWKHLLEQLRNRFVHRGIFLLRNDFDIMKEILGHQDNLEILTIKYFKELYKNLEVLMEVVPVQNTIESTEEAISVQNAIELAESPSEDMPGHNDVAQPVNDSLTNEESN